MLGSSQPLIHSTVGTTIIRPAPKPTRAAPICWRYHGSSSPYVGWCQVEGIGIGSSSGGSSSGSGSAAWECRCEWDSEESPSLNTGASVRCAGLAEATRLARLVSPALVGRPEPLLCCCPAMDAASKLASSCVRLPPGSCGTPPSEAGLRTDGNSGPLPEDASFTTNPSYATHTLHNNGVARVFILAQWLTRAPRVPDGAADQTAFRSISERAASCLRQVFPVDPTGRTYPLGPLRK